MPNVKIELLEGRTTEQKAAVAKAVTEALVLVNHADSNPEAVDMFAAVTVPLRGRSQ